MRFFSPDVLYLDNGRTVGHYQRNPGNTYDGISYGRPPDTEPGAKTSARAASNSPAGVAQHQWDIYPRTAVRARKRGRFVFVSARSDGRPATEALGGVHFFFTATRVVLFQRERKTVKRK